MWFQDLFNYDFRRTEMCIIPYATQEGEISFCAYNTGIGWRNIIEKMHMTATLTKWYEEHGRHEIFAGNKAVPLDTTAHSLVLERRGRGHGRADRPRRAGHRQERARGEAAARAEDRRRNDGDARARWPRSTASTCSRSSPTDLQIQGLGGRRRRTTVQAVLHKPTSDPTLRLAQLGTPQARETASTASRRLGRLLGAGSAAGRYSIITLLTTAIGPSR